MNIKFPLRIICHSKNAINVGLKFGWLPGANYNHTRNIKEFNTIGLIDIDWNNYDFDKHLYYVKKYRPFLTVAKDIITDNELDNVLKQAEKLERFASKIIIVPKAKNLGNAMDRLIPKKFIIGFSVPSSYGTTEIPIGKFLKRRIHLLGGRPDIQRELATVLDIVSFDCNRITIDAKFGYYFNGSKFTKNDTYGYTNCIEKSIVNINKIWMGYKEGKHG